MTFFGRLVQVLVSAAVVIMATGISVASDPFTALKMNRFPAESVATPFELTTLDEQVVKSSEFAGKVVLINFWATWCGPCKDEMPSLARLQSQFDPDRFLVITVTADRHPQGIKQFFNHLGISLPVLFDDDQQLSRAFMVRGLPTSVLISSNGHPLGRAVGPRTWDSTESIALVQQFLDVPR